MDTHFVCDLTNLLDEFSHAASVAQTNDVMTRLTIHMDKESLEQFVRTPFGIACYLFTVQLRADDKAAMGHTLEALSWLINMLSADCKKLLALYESLDTPTN